MRRTHLFEFGDLAALPRFLRDYITDYLCFVETMAKSALDCFVEPIERMLARAPHRAIVDLCSGGAGPWHVLAKRVDAPITLTDLSPNLPAFHRAKHATGGRISFVEHSVDATNVPDELPGVRTIFNGFHHFSPGKARELLADAARKGQPIAVFEMLGRHPLQLLSALLIPIMVLAVTPFIRPLRLGRFVWTYLVPIMPLIGFWDGLVSMLRVYSQKELMELTQGIDVPGYTWDIGEIRVGAVGLPYLCGYPSAASR